MTKQNFDTDFEYDEWYEKKREEKLLKDFGDEKEVSEDEWDIY